MSSARRRHYSDTTHAPMVLYTIVNVEMPPAPGGADRSGKGVRGGGASGEGIIGGGVGGEGGGYIGADAIILGGTR